MCGQCTCDGKTLGYLGKEKMKNSFFFGIAQKDSLDIKKGQYYLGIINDPDFILTIAPEIAPKDQPVEIWCTWSEKVDKFRESFMSSNSYTHYLLIKACIRSGYRRSKHGDEMHWLFNFLGKMVPK